VLCYAMLCATKDSHATVFIADLDSKKLVNPVHEQV
jgi:hypothetical protein